MTSNINLPLSTSETYPIEVNFVPHEALKLAGRLGMTIAPGKQNQGRQMRYQRNLKQDLTRLHDHYKTDVLISLIEESELAELQISTLFDDIQAHGMKLLRFPIRDFSAPTSIQGTIELVQQILALVEQGQTVVVHCKAGLGRTGLVIACCLVALGYSPVAAFEVVRHTRPGSVETQEQENFVDQFAQVWQVRD